MQGREPGGTAAREARVLAVEDFAEGLSGLWLAAVSLAPSEAAPCSLAHVEVWRLEVARVEVAIPGFDLIDNETHQVRATRSRSSRIRKNAELSTLSGL